MPPSTTNFFLGGNPCPDYRTDHPQVALYDAPLVYQDGVTDVVYVDLLMADPLLRMWRAGIYTTWSCQGQLHPYPSGFPSGYCVITDASRTYEAVKIIGTAFDVATFRFDSLRLLDYHPDEGEVIRWTRR